MVSLKCQNVKQCLRRRYDEEFAIDHWNYCDNRFWWIIFYSLNTGFGFSYCLFFRGNYGYYYFNHWDVCKRYRGRIKIITTILIYALIITLMVLLGIIFSLGKGSALIAGFNTLPKK